MLSCARSSRLRACLRSRTSSGCARFLDQISLCVTIDARSGLTGSSLCCLPRNLLYLFGPALRHVSALLDSVDSTVSFSSRCLCNMQNRRSAILVSMVFTLLGLKAEWYLCKITDFVTYLALLVKCRSHKDATNYNPLAQWQAFQPRTPAYDGSALIGDHG
jgi:hypothetical protein